MARYMIDNIEAPIPWEDAGKSGLLRTLQNCKNLIMMKMGEVPYDRMRGVSLDIFHMPMPELNARILREIDAVLMYEPYAEAVSAECSLNEEGELIIRVEIETDIDND